MRYTGWRRLRGDTQRRPDLLDIGKKLLGALAARRTRGAPATLTHRVTMPDGSEVTAGFIKNQPYIDVRDVNEDVGPVIRFKQYLISAEFINEDASGYCIYEIGAFEQLGDGPVVQTTDTYERIFKSSAFAQSLISVSVNAEGDTAAFCDITAGSESVHVFDISTLTQQVQIRNIPYDTQSLPLVAGFAEDGIYVSVFWVSGSSAPGNYWMDFYGDDGFSRSVFPQDGYRNGNILMTNGAKYAIGSFGDGQSYVFSAGAIAAQLPFSFHRKTAAISASGKYVYAGAQTILQAWQLSYNDSGVPVSATRLAEIDVSDAYVSFEGGALTPSGKRLFVSFDDGVTYTRNYVWEIETKSMPAIARLTDGGGNAIDQDGARRIFMSYADLQVIGSTADSRKVIAYARTSDNRDVIVVYDLKERRVIAEMAMAFNITGSGYAINDIATTFTVGDSRQ